MPLKMSRTRSLLEPAGFEVALATWPYDWYFVRRDRHPGLFQWVHIAFAGRRREAVAGRVGVSVTRHRLLDDLCESRLLVQLASDPERGQSLILNPEEAGDWVRRFAEVAPRQAEALAGTEGPEILGRTAVAREVAERYRKRLPRADSPYAQSTELRRQFRPELVEAALRLADWPGIRRLHGTGEIYELACLCILGYEREVEGRQRSFQLDASLDGAERGLLVRPPVSPPSEELHWRIQFLVDRLIDQWNGIEGSGLSLSPRP